MAFGLVGKAQRENYEVVEAFNTSVKHVPGLTWSISGTYLPGSDRRQNQQHGDSIGFNYAYVYSSRRKNSWALQIQGPSTCAPSIDAQGALTRALISTLNRAGDWPADGTIKVTLVPSNQPVKRYVIALRAGRHFALNFKAPCHEGDADDALWAAAMMGLHESTHAALRLSGQQPPGRIERERIAYGAEACIALELESTGDPLQHYPAVTQRLRGGYQLGNEKRTMNSLCAVWAHHLRSAGSATLSAAAK